MLLGLHTYSLYLHGIGQAWADFKLPWPRQLTTFELFDLAVDLGLDGLGGVGPPADYAVREERCPSSHRLATLSVSPDTPPLPSRGHSSPPSPPIDRAAPCTGHLLRVGRD